MNTVETALSTSGLPIQAQACLAALCRGELGRWFASPDAFMILYGGGIWTGPTTGFPDWAGAKGPDGQPTHAALFLQFEPATYAECAAATGKADIWPQSQIINGWWLVQHVAGMSVLSQLSSGNLTAVAHALVGTWPAGAGSNFPGFYASEMAILTAVAPPAPPVSCPVPASVTVIDSAGKVYSGTLDTAQPKMVITNQHGNPSMLRSSDLG